MTSDEIEEARTAARSRENRRQAIQTTYERIRYREHGQAEFSAAVCMCVVIAMTLASVFLLQGSAWVKVPIALLGTTILLGCMPILTNPPHMPDWNDFEHEVDALERNITK